MNIPFKLTALATAIALIFGGDVLAQVTTTTTTATTTSTTTTSTAGQTSQLPTGLVAELKAAIPGLTVGSDGQLKIGTTSLIPILPPNYDAAKLDAKLADFKQMADGSFVGTGNLQFVPVEQTPGSFPKLPDNFTPVTGGTFPSNFSPPAGFITPSTLALPSGVTVPAKTPESLINDLVDAGTIPKGLVTFNSDGTVQTSTGAAFIPFVPAADQQGKYKAGGSTSVTIDSKTNAITFPDGTVLAPLVAGTNPGDKTLPKGFTAPSDVTMPKEVTLPPQFEIPKDMPLPAGVTLPAGVSIPSDYQYMIPPGTQMPAGASIPSTVKVSSDVVIPPGITLPAGTKIDSASNLPKGTTVLPDGSVVVPGTQIPASIVPPASWTPPAGVTKDSTGAYYVPPPPTAGYAEPAAPKAVNADGSIVIAAPSDPTKLPSGATLNADGTYTLAAPAFIGEVDDSGKIAAFSGVGAASTPTAFTPTAGFQEGSSIAGASTPATVGSDGKVTMPAPPVGTAPPSGAVQNADGTYTVPAPAGFEKPTVSADGSTTVKLPDGATPPPGATINADGTVTIGAAPPPNITPPTGGSTTPPTDGGSTTPPTDGGSTTPPTDGGSTTPPTGGGSTTPPTGGGTSTPPTGGGTSTPPTGGGTSTPPIPTPEPPPSTGGGGSPPGGAGGGGPGPR